MSLNVDEGQVFNAKLNELESAIELIEGIGIDLSKIKGQKELN